MLIRKALLGLVLGGLISAAHAQAPSPADVGIVHGNPDVFKLLDSTKTWTPFGSVDPSTHIFTPVGGGGVSGTASLTTYSTHSALLNLATTPTGPWTVVQQGFYASGDGGAATYDWNATSFCANATSGAAAQSVGDGFVCILPSAQNKNTAGRYLLRLTNGALNVRQIGFKDDGTDNGPLVDTLKSVMGSFTGVYGVVSIPILFPANPATVQSNYWFNRPLSITHDGSITCADGSRVAIAPRVNLVFGPGAGGINIVGEGADREGGFGAVLVSVNGCGIFSTGRGSTTTVTGNNTINNAALAYPSQILNGSLQAAIKFSVGDGVAAFPGYVLWNFSGYIVNDVLTVTTFSGGYSATDPGIAAGQMLVGTPVRGLYIKATHAENATFTGVGHEGTYQLSHSLIAPAVPEQAIPSGLYASAGSPVGFQTVVQTGPPAIPMGTSITGCSTLSGTLCNGTTGTLTISNAATIGTIGFMWDLPGPNAIAPNTDQSFTVTTSSKGNVYGPITAGISGNLMTVTAGGANLKIGQDIFGGNGGIVSPTTTASLTIGQLTGIPVSSCAGIAANADVAAFSGGNTVFPPFTTVAGCTGTTLSLNAQYTSGAVVTTVSGSAVVQAYDTTNFNPWKIWKGEPVGGSGIPVNTTVQSWRFSPYKANQVEVTLSNAATASAPSVALNFGGAIVAAPSGTVINVTPSSNSRILNHGTVANTYIMDYGSFSLPPGSTLFAQSDPGEMFVTGGPRIPLPQELLWMDGVPFGTVAAKIYGVAPSDMAIITADTGTYNQVPIWADHPSGSGKMWILPSGILATTMHNTFGNLIGYFPGVGVSMACAATNYYPSVGCGRSHDTENGIFYNVVGRLVVGNNAGGFAASFEEYDHNNVADIVDYTTVGGTNISQMLQGEDESSNTHDLVQNCTTGSVYMGIYASGSQYEATCPAPSGFMLSSQTIYQGPWLGANMFGALFGGPFDVGVVPGLPQSLPSCTGAPTSSFRSQGGIVTHC